MQFRTTLSELPDVFMEMDVAIVSAAWIFRFIQYLFIMEGRF